MKHVSIALLGAAALVSTTSAQARYDFDHLSGSDPFPYTPLHFQDNWSEQTFNAPQPLGVTATLSHDGTQSIRFQQVGAGYGSDASRINDANWSYAPFTGLETTAFFQADITVGHWGGTFGPAHDADGSGSIRASQPGERGVRFLIGGQANAQMQLVRADQTSVTVPLAGLGISAGDWVRVRVVMDLTANAGAGAGTLEYLNITTGGTAFTPAPGLEDISLALDGAASDARNPALWDALWLHLEGSSYSLDNIEVGERIIGANYCSPALPNSSGAPATITAVGSVFVAAGDLTLIADDLPAGQFGYFLAGQTQGFFVPPGSQGFICLSGNIGRYNQIANIIQGPTGSIGVDLTSIPVNPPRAVVPGDTWNFQCWFRDNNPTLTSNFTDGVSILFQ